MIKADKAFKSVVENGHGWMLGWAEWQVMNLVYRD